eukprot:NODE_928_length_1114_cov_96.584600_g885_i0.p1 GENE.NODE_928_length_1114_cov_96.584600_g885_i0~~NODE_928_length_1114_cov_96.584600_g885_i0.p1  ORF type:complete len:320 (-),score=52.18 NODE_928_length_1114_cov_96.584600_g885_i0:31-990(-)
MAERNEKEKQKESSSDSSSVVKRWDQYEVWKNFKYPINSNGVRLTLQGHAMSGEKSGFWIPEWKVMLDAGIQSPFDPQHIFISHPHSDHCFALPMLVTAISTKPTVYVPKGIGQFMVDFITSLQRLTCADGSVDGSDMCIIREVEPHEEFDVKFKSQRVKVTVLETFHTVPSVGYAFSAYRSRLKQEYQGKPPAELKQAKQNGVDITEEICLPVLAYTGDTTPKVFEANPFLQTVPVVMTECTFIAELEGGEEATQVAVAERAESHQHTHWRALDPWIAKLQTVQFILIHWSQRYRTQQLQEFFAAKAGTHPNIYPWFN